MAMLLKGFLMLLFLSAAHPADSASPKKVIFDHDGGIDDFVTLLLLMSRPDLIDIVGVTILDADCQADVALNTTLKILHTLSAKHIPVAVSTFKGVNPFPNIWRWNGISVDVLPLINNIQPGTLHDQFDNRPGEDVFTELLLNQDEPVIIVATGPLSNLAYALEKHGAAAASKMKEIWWMGGALNVHGNVHFPGHDGSAEWNAFWDPLAMGPVWESDVPLIIVPLDATNHVPVSPDLLYRFGPQSDYKFSAMAASIWSKVVTWVFERPNEPYFAWDTLTAACLMEQDLCERQDGMRTYAVLTGASQGRTVLTAGESCDSLMREASRSREVSVIMHVDAEKFYTYILDSLKK